MTIVPLADPSRLPLVAPQDEVGGVGSVRFKTYLIPGSSPGQALRCREAASKDRQAVLYG